MRLFISHSHSDKLAAAALVDYLVSALHIEAEDIVCTSVAGSKLPFGEGISVQLRNSLQSSVGVFGLLTKTSLESNWVLFELGSAWALAKIVIPILGPGLTLADLPGPLVDRPSVVAEEADASSRLADAVHQVAIALGIKERGGGRPIQKCAEFLETFRKDMAAETAGDALSRILDVDGRTVVALSQVQEGRKYYRREPDTRVETALLRFVRTPISRLDGDFSIEDCRDNVIVLGSTRYNKAAERIQRYFSPPYQYVYSTYDEIPGSRQLSLVTQYGDEFISSADRRGAPRDVEVDYGVLFLGALPNRKRLLWISGIHGAGTEGAFKFLRQNASEIAGTLPCEPGTGVARLLRIRYVWGKDGQEFELRHVEQLGNARETRARSEPPSKMAVVSDLGNVVMYFDRSRTYRALAHLLDERFEEVQQKIEGSDLRQRYETGQVEDEEFCAELLRILDAEPDKIPSDFLVEFWSDIFWQNPPMFEALRCLQADGVPLVLLSNTNRLHFTRVKSDYPDVLGLFDSMVLSYEEKQVKPDRRLFDRALEEVHKQDPSIAARDILYVDDREEHVNAARERGMTGFVFRSYLQFALWLRAHGLYVP